MTTDSNIKFKLRPVLALLALLLSGQLVHAQDQDVPSHYLLIFDTSADMKHRVKAEQFEITQILSTSMGGQLQDGDSLGVWAFDQTLRAGQFPLVTWAPEDANDIGHGINAFISQQHYSKTTRFAALQPLLNQVIQGSPRLTVIIFSDGEDNITWTPYNDGINEMFSERKATQLKSRQPFILVIRFQFGQYVGCTINFPPGMLNFPPFPPLPPPPPVETAPAPTPVVVPESAPQTNPSLIMVGTNIMDNNTPAAPVSQPTPVVTHPAVITNKVVITNTTVVINAPPAVTNLIAPSTPASSTNPAVPPANSSFTRRDALFLGAGLLIAAAGLIALGLSRSRNADRTSLITRSMRKD